MWVKQLKLKIIKLKLKSLDWILKWNDLKGCDGNKLSMVEKFRGLPSERPSCKAWAKDVLQKFNSWGEGGRKDVINEKTSENMFRFVLTKIRAPKRATQLPSERFSEEKTIHISNTYNLYIIYI